MAILFVFFLGTKIIYINYLNRNKFENLNEADEIYKKILSAIYFKFYDYKKIQNHYAYSLGISKIDILKDKNYKIIKEPLTIEITLRSPGILIDKGGSTLEKIKKRISEDTNIDLEKIKINLKQYDIFKQIFS